MPQADLPRMTAAEFFAWAERQDVPYELVRGVPVPLLLEADGHGSVRAMAAARAAHNAVLFATGKAIDRRRPAGCAVYLGRVGVATGGDTLREPDVVLQCGPVAPDAVAMPNPVLLVEVLSPTTADVDRGEKLDEYKELPAVREVWLVHSARRAVTVWRRGSEGWEAADTIARGALASAVLGDRVPLDELYGDLEV